MTERIVISHGNCYDGFAASLAAWLKFGSDARYVFAQYGQPVVEVPDGAEVYMIDFSYSREVIESMAKRCASLVVLDHHKTAQAALEGLPYATFDMNKSGAVLAWEYFLPDLPLPRMFEYVQDRDLWTWKLPHSEAVNAFIKSHPYDFAVWHEMLVTLDDGSGFEKAVQSGQVVLGFQARMVEMIVAQAAIREVGGYVVPVVNATAFWSEVGNLMCQKYQDHPFAASFYYSKEGNRVWSLRSVGEFDVSAVAKLKGGGHRNAAGFTENTVGQAHLVL
jgi:uncharacterized protein